MDPGESPVDTALREAHEELGIDPAQVRVIGEGDPMRTGTGFEITPVIGLVPPDIPIIPNPSEVAQWFEAPLDHVLNPANHHMRVGQFKDARLPFWEIDWGEHRIWGATAGLIVNLSRRLAWHG
jgi:8-oxo-dGTP pyrophosphatase MutT (NUDIX family)